MKISQCERMLRHIQDFGSISTREAVYEYGIMRPGSRVKDLRDKGYPIITKMEKGKNRYDEVVPYARYSLEKTSENNTSVSAPQ